MSIYGQFNRSVELSYQEIRAWSLLKGITLDPLEVDMLMFIHITVIEYHADER